MKSNLKAILGLSILLSSTNALSSQMTISRAIQNGAVKIAHNSIPKIDPDLEELINQINKFQPSYNEPILIFDGQECFINNPELLEEIISTASATFTSI